MGSKLPFAAVLSLLTSAAVAAPVYDSGASDSEIKIGNIMPYSGPASAYSLIGKVQAAYFKMINDNGGINGRKLTFISYDDSYSPPKSVEQVRKLVESDEVLFVFSPLGTAPNVAIQKFLNAKKVPQLFAVTGATKFGFYKDTPWSIAWQPSYKTEGRIYAKYLVDNKPDAKIAVLYQNDDLGKDLLKSLKDGLGEKASQIVAEESFELAEPTIDSHIVKLRASGADTVVSLSTTKPAAQAIKKVAEIGWKPLYIQCTVGTSIGGTIKPAGFENAQGILSASYMKDASDSQWVNDPGMKKLDAFLAQYMPGVDKSDAAVTYGYGSSQTVAQVIKQAGDNLTRDNIMKEAANLKHLLIDVLLPGVEVNTSPTDFYPIEQMRMMRFKGEQWELFGPLLDGSE
ncbi:ABC transporter substrate-binding protein [Bradyrhizobium betae]|uniref:Branched-chain amino acid ABC transporter substrate-binding protein n=1 Tax=Bradyrhizobium betae TaxID=244734 RepID=A0A4Q1VRR3_9BRAD|nr:ABC transporter substrate-binding protein [Bradyrhizobium betae]RXT54236.1 branched-chain amino acid ABC transporter substrate-binding protein [Bradyrhizobium betae]